MPDGHDCDIDREVVEGDSEKRKREGEEAGEGGGGETGGRRGWEWATPARRRGKGKGRMESRGGSLQIGPLGSGRSLLPDEDPAESFYQTQQHLRLML